VQGNTLNVAIVILAAGASSRLGYPKQLVTLDGKSLLSRLIDEVSPFDKDMYLITGAFHREFKNVAGNTISIVQNQDWEDGMGSSIAKAVEHLKQDYDGIILTLSDQPFISAQIFKDILSTISADKNKIIKSKYSEGSGPPVYFPSKYFPLLSTLSGDQGASQIIKDHLDQIIEIDFPKGHLDIDTLEQINHLRKEYGIHLEIPL